jgi:hypothetical protein
MRCLRFCKREMILGLLSLSLLSIPGGGCGSGGGGGSAGTTDLQGTVALNDGSVGTLNVTIQSTVAKSFRFSLIREAAAQASGTVPATGDCVSPTCTIPNLTGTYNPSTGALDLSGSGSGGGCGGTTTTFAGTVTPPTSGGSGGMSGTIQDSGGTSIGGFSGVFETSGTAAAVYCGIAVSGDTDAFNVNVDAEGNLTGTAQPIDGSNGKPVSFSGTATGTTFGACGKEEGDTGPSRPICGVIGSDGSINGRFIRKEGGEGCFTGDSTVCTTGTLPAPCAGPTAACTYPTCL